MTQAAVNSFDTPTSQAEFESQLLAVLPALRSFGRRFAAGSSDVEDLVQETAMKALANSHRFTAGTSMKSWTFTILRNLYMTEYKQRRREPNLGNDLLYENLHVAPAQEWAVRTSEMARALEQLPRANREILLSVAMGGTYEESAAANNCEVGTIKSRVSRARANLANRLGSLVHEEAYSACL